MYHAYNHTPRTPREYLATIFYTFGKVRDEYPTCSLDQAWVIVYDRLHITPDTVSKCVELCGGRFPFEQFTDGAGI